MKKTIFIITLVFAITLFTFIVTSQMPGWLQFAACIGILVVYGNYLRRNLKNASGGFGFIMIRGTAGFNTMKKFAEKYPNLSKELCDFGLTIGFGILYSFYLFKLSKKFFIHALILIAMSGGLYYLALQNSTIDTTFAILFFLFGFFGSGAYLLGQSLVNIFTTPNAPPAIAPVIPGVTIPLYAILSIAVIAFVHEVAHGIMCAIYKIKVKSSGILLFGFIPVGAFVEPNEKEFEKKKIEEKRHVLIAGSASNLLFFFIFIPLWILPALSAPLFVNHLNLSLTANSTINRSFDDSTVYSINGVNVTSLNDVKINQNTITIQTDKGTVKTKLVDFKIDSVTNNDNKNILYKGEIVYDVEGIELTDTANLRNLLNSRKLLTVKANTSMGVKDVHVNADGKMGITFEETQPTIDFTEEGQWTWIANILRTIADFFSLTAILSLSLSLFNVLPIFITDGHKIVYDQLKEWFGSAGVKIAITISIILALILLVNLYPWFSKLF
ncbi:Peptidase family M50 [uncultured archaeon]|nr:Peptidase family M50 [uncultured archaeon]